MPCGRMWEVPKLGGALELRPFPDPLETRISPHVYAELVAVGQTVWA